MGKTGAKLLAAAVLLCAAGVATSGAHGTFTATVTVRQALHTGTTGIELTGTGASGTKLAVPVSNLAPGGSLQRVVTLTNSKDVRLSTVTVTSTANPSSALDTDTADGLRLTVEDCAVPWSDDGGGSYSCADQVSVLLGPRPVIGTGLDLGQFLDARTKQLSDHLRFTLALPATSPAGMQALSSTLEFAFTPVRRAPTNK